MSLNTRKKQVKPKVTIDQKEATISTGKKFKGVFSGIFAFFTKKRLILLSLVSIFTFGILKYYPDIKNLSTLSILDNSFIMDQEKKLLEIENKIVSNKEKLDLLEEKDDVLLNLQAKILELNTEIQEISEKNNLITQQNKELIDYIELIREKPKDLDVKIEEPKGIQKVQLDYEERILFDQQQNKDSIYESNINTEAVKESPINKSIDDEKNNLAALIIDKIEENVRVKENFDDEVELLLTLDLDYENIDNLKNISNSPIPTPEEIISELDNYLKENINLYIGDNKLKSKFFDILSREVNVARVNYSDTSLIEELKSNIYNDDLTDAKIILSKLEFRDELIDISEKLELRTVYLNELNNLKLRFENN